MSVGNLSDFTVNKVRSALFFALKRRQAIETEPIDWRGECLPNVIKQLRDEHLQGVGAGRKTINAVRNYLHANGCHFEGECCKEKARGLQAAESDGQSAVHSNIGCDSQSVQDGMAASECL